MIIDDLDTLLDAASEALGVRREDILGDTRLQMPSLARQIVMALWSEGHSLQESAAAVGRTSHSLAVYARRRIFDGLHSKNKLRQRVKGVLELYREKKARPSQLVLLPFLAILTGFPSTLNPRTETTNTNNNEPRT